jgi:hypothetical protein
MDVLMGSRTSQSGIARRGGVRGCACALAGGIVLALGAQSVAGEPGLVRVDQGIADRDQLAVSFRYLEPDIRQDLGFEHLYVDAADPGRYVRVSGAMYAVSPRTDYVSLKSGVYPAVSPGTVFYIGARPEEDRALGVAPRDGRATGVTIAASAPVSQRVSLARPVGPAPVAVRADASVDGAADPAAGSRVTPTPVSHDMANQSYRAARLREIARLMGGAK